MDLDISLRSHFFPTILSLVLQFNRSLTYLDTYFYFFTIFLFLWSVIDAWYKDRKRPIQLLQPENGDKFLFVNVVLVLFRIFISFFMQFQ